MGGDRGPSGFALAGAAKTYRTGGRTVEAVRGVDLDVAQGETVALLGPNGAGKSTTIDLVLGLLEPDRGTVAVLGDAPARAVGEGRVGAMLQAGGLIRDVTVRELVGVVASLFPAPLAVNETLSLAGVSDIADRRVEKLSGGQTQRVRFAVALAGDPDLLVLDEPTVGMDVETRQSFWAAVRDFARRGRTVLFATHYLAEADAYADRVVLMARGLVVADGSTTEIKAMVGSRTIRATLAGVPEGVLAQLSGVSRAERHGDAVVLTCADSDAAVRALLAAHPEAHDLEIQGAALEEAFVQLTGETA